MTVSQLHKTNQSWSLKNERGEEIEKLGKFCKKTARSLQQIKDKLKVASKTIAYYRERANLIPVPRHKVKQNNLATKQVNEHALPNFAVCNPV